MQRNQRRLDPIAGLGRSDGEYAIDDSGWLRIPGYRVAHFRDALTRSSNSSVEIAGPS